MIRREYTVVRGADDAWMDDSSFHRFLIKVEVKLAEGWQLEGGVVALDVSKPLQQGPIVLFAQAMSRESESG